MFTGIIEEIGNIVKISKGRRSSALTVAARRVFDDLKVGDSVAVNGVCLTVRSMDRTAFVADVMSETLSRSALGRLKDGSPVNLERAVPANGRFGGHIVSGHIDGTGTITCVQKDDNAIWYTVGASEEILRYIVEKGSIAVDGISLTVARSGARDFAVSVIPHTARETVLGNKTAGDIVNLENDLMAKYIEKLLTHPRPAAEPPPGVTMEFLAQKGFL